MFQVAKQDLLLTKKNQDMALRKKAQLNKLITSKAFSVAVDNRGLNR